MTEHYSDRRFRLADATITETPDGIVASGGVRVPVNPLYDWPPVAPWNRADCPTVPDRGAYNWLVAPRLTFTFAAIAEARWRVRAAISVLRRGVTEDDPYGWHAADAHEWSDVDGGEW